MFTFRKPTYFFQTATKPRGELLPIEIDTIEQAIIDLLSALRTLRSKGN